MQGVQAVIHYFRNVYEVPGQPHYVGDYHLTHAEADESATDLGFKRIGVLRIRRKAVVEFVERIRT